jgi:quinol monooxygenase YgiN
MLLDHVDIVCHILTQTSNNLLQVQEVLEGVSAWIKANEPGTLRYHLQRETKGDAPTFILLESYVFLGPQ